MKIILQNFENMKCVLFWEIAFRFGKLSLVTSKTKTELVEYDNKLLKELYTYIVRVLIKSFQESFQQLFTKYLNNSTVD